MDKIKDARIIWKSMQTIRARRSISVDNQLVINRSCTYKSALCQVMPSFMLSHNHIVGLVPIQWLLTS